MQINIYYFNNRLTEYIMEIFNMFDISQSSSSNFNMSTNIFKPHYIQDEFKKTINKDAICTGECNINLQYIVNILFNKCISQYIIRYNVKATDIMFIWKGSMAMRSIYYKYLSIFDHDLNLFNRFKNLFGNSDADYGIFINPNIKDYNMHFANWVKLSFFILTKIRNLIQIEDQHIIKDLLYTSDGKFILFDEYYTRDKQNKIINILPSHDNDQKNSNYYINNYSSKHISIHDIPPQKICDFNKSFILLRLNHIRRQSEHKHAPLVHYEIIDIAIRRQDDSSLLNDYNYMKNYMKLCKVSSSEQKDFNCINYIIRLYEYKNGNIIFNYYTYTFDGYILDIINILFKSNINCLPDANNDIKNIKRLFYFILLKFLEIKQEHKVDSRTIDQYIEYLIITIREPANITECPVSSELLILPYLYSIQSFIITYANSMLNTMNLPEQDLRSLVVYEHLKVLMIEYMTNIRELINRKHILVHFLKKNNYDTIYKVLILQKYMKYKIKYLNLKNKNTDSKF